MAKARKAPRRGASRASPKSGPRVPVWLIACCVAVVGLFVAFLFTLEPGQDSVKRDTVVTPPAPKAEPPRRQSPSYDFYTLLPESEVVSTGRRDRKSTRLKSSHVRISYAVFSLKKKTTYQ